MIVMYEALKNLIEMYEKWEDLKIKLTSKNSIFVDKEKKNSITMWIEDEKTGKTDSYLIDHMVGNYEDIDILFRTSIAQAIDKILIKIDKERASLCGKHMKYLKSK